MDYLHIMVNQKLSIIYFLILFVLNIISCLWIFDLLYKAAGTTKKQAKEYIKNQESEKRFKLRMLDDYMISIAPNLHSYHAVKLLFFICILPGLCCFVLSFSDSLRIQHKLFTAGEIMPAVIIIMSAFGTFYKMITRRINAKGFNKKEMHRYQGKSYYGPRTIPLYILISGILTDLYTKALMPFMSILFTVYGFLLGFSKCRQIALYIIIFYIFTSIIDPIRYLKKQARIIKIYEYYDIVENLLESDSKNIFSAYRKVTDEIDKYIEADSSPKKDEEQNYYDNVQEEDEPYFDETLYSDEDFTPGERLGNKQPSKLSGLLALIPITFGVIFIFASIYFAYISIDTFREQYEVKDWPIKMASVTNVVEHRDVLKGKNQFSLKPITLYDIEYEYFTGYDWYKGVIKDSPDAMEEHDKFDIKHSPDSPEISTTVIEEPDIQALIINLTGALLFLIIGLRFAGIINFIQRRIREHSRK